MGLPQCRSWCQGARFIEKYGLAKRENGGPRKYYSLIDREKGHRKCKICEIIYTSTSTTPAPLRCLCCNYLTSVMPQNNKSRRRLNDKRLLTLKILKK